MGGMKPRDRGLAERLTPPILWGQAYLKNRDETPWRCWLRKGDDIMTGNAEAISIFNKKLKSRFMSIRQVIAVVLYRLLKRVKNP